MKIAMPTDKKDLGANVCVSFGRAPYFLIYDTDTKESSFLDNTAAASASGAGIKAAQIIVDSGAKALLTPRCGQNAAEVISGADIKIYKTVHTTIKESLDAFAAGKLAILDEIHEGLHGPGGA